MSAQNVVVFRCKDDRVLFSVSEKLFSTEDASNLDQLVVIVVTMEEGLFAKDLLTLSHSVQSLPSFYLPCLQTCSHNSTYPDCNRILESRPRAQVP